MNGAGELIGLRLDGYQAENWTPSGRLAAEPCRRFGQNQRNEGALVVLYLVGCTFMS